MILMDNDWRITYQKDYLDKKQLELLKYQRHSKIWDHDHCEFCFKTFSEFEGDLHEGYCTEDKIHWICEDCFHEFKEMFEWTEKV